MCPVAQLGSTCRSETSSSRLPAPPPRLPPVTLPPMAFRHHLHSALVRMRTESTHRVIARSSLMSSSPPTFYFYFTFYLCFFLMFMYFVVFFRIIYKQRNVHYASGRDRENLWFRRLIAECTPNRGNERTTTSPKCGEPHFSPSSARPDRSSFISRLDRYCK